MGSFIVLLKHLIGPFITLRAFRMPAFTMILNAKQRSNSHNLNDIGSHLLFMYHPVVKERMFAASNKITTSLCNKVSRGA
jgi:hypothetical protein